MPYAVRLYLITQIEPTSAERLEASWWPASHAMRLPGLREMYDNSAYVDYLAGLSPEDTFRLSEEVWNSGPYAMLQAEEPVRGGKPFEEYRALRSALQTKGRVQWVLVQVYEWESGLD